MNLNSQPKIETEIKAAIIFIITVIAGSVYRFFNFNKLVYDRIRNKTTHLQQTIPNR
jgi:hypothetical protein